jgi:integrase
MRFLDHDQVDSLAEAISHPVLRRPGNGAAPWWRSDLPEYGLLIRLAAYGGLRAGEIGALRVRRVDLGAGSVEVVESVAEVGGRLEIGSTKTYRPRVVPLPRSVVDQLAEHMQGMAEDAFVFTSPTGGPLRHSTFYKRHFRPAVAQAELPADLRFHDLRHTYAGFLIAEGAHPRMMMERLGHSSIQVTLGTYGHLLPSLGEQLTDALDERLRAAVGARVEAVSGEASRTNRAHNQASMNVTN